MGNNNSVTVCTNTPSNFVWNIYVLANLLWWV